MCSKEKILLLLLVVMCNLGSLSAVQCRNRSNHDVSFETIGDFTRHAMLTLQDAQPITSKETYVSTTA